METQLNTPRSVQTENTKQKIYEAAESILKKKGYAYLTVSNICSVAGISNGTFFYHFKTKDELLTFYTYKGFAEFRREHGFDEKVEGLPFEGKILAFYCCWADYMEEMGIDFFSNFYTTKNHSLDIRRWNQREPVYVWNYPGECLQQAQDEGRIKPELTVAHCAEVLGSLAKGAAFDWCLCGGKFDMRARIHEMMGPYLNSIRA